MDFLADLFTGGLAGGLTGILGSIFTAFATYKMKKLEYAHEATMRDKDIEATKAEAEAAVKREEAITAGKVQVSELEAFKESLGELKRSFFDQSYMEQLPKTIAALVALLFAALDALRASVRPVITYYAMGALTWLAYLSYQSNPKAFVADARLIVTAIVYIAITAVTWWFADRRLAKAMSESLEGRLS